MPAGRQESGGGDEGEAAGPDRTGVSDDCLPGNSADMPRLRRFFLYGVAGTPRPHRSWRVRRLSCGPSRVRAMCEQADRADQSCRCA